MIFDDKGVFGFDVSFYQAFYNRDNGKWTYIDFQKMKDYGASFVIIKCGQDDYLDPTFAHHWKEAKRIGIPRGSYWFLDQDNQAQEQARIYWNAVKDDPGEGPLVVDYEYGSGGMWQVLYDFIAELQRLSGYPDNRIWIYTGYFYWIEHRPQSLAQRAFFSKYPLWLAYYTDSPEKAQCPSDWEEPVLWQEGTPAIGLAAGAQSREIDRNRFNGNDLAKHFSTSTGTTMPTPATQYRFTYSPLTTERTSPATTGAPTGRQYVPGNIVNVVRILSQGSDQWFELDNGKYAAYIYNGTTRAELVSSPPTTITVKHTIDVYTDGSLKIDGTFIP